MKPLSEWDSLLAEIEEEFHPHNCIAMDVKRVIIQILGNRKDHRVRDLTEEQLKRKIDLCREYMHVSGKRKGNKLWGTLSIRLSVV